MKNYGKNRTAKAGFSVKLAGIAGLVVAAALVAAGCKGSAIANAPGEDDPHGNDPSAITGPTLSATSLVLLVGKGTLNLSAILSQEAAAASTLEWTVSPANIVTLTAEGDHVTVEPAGAGQAVITAHLTAKEGVTFAADAVLTADCAVTVLDNFALNTTTLLLFESDDTAQTVGTTLTTSEYAALSQVADITWSVTGDAAQIPEHSTGGTVAVSLRSGDTETIGSDPQQINAQLIVKQGSEAFFNADGTYAVPATVKLFPQPDLTIHNAAGKKRLATGDAAQEFAISLSYPQELAEFAPTVQWTTSQESVAAVAGGTVESGAANATLTAQTAGTANIGATLYIAGRSIPAPVQTVTVINYAAIEWDVDNLAIAGAVAADGTLTLKDTETSADITVTAQRLADANQPDDKTILWAADITKVSIEQDFASDSNGGKITIKGVNQTAGNVTVTASSQSNPDVTVSFTVKVNPIAINITGSPAANFTYNGTANGLALAATADIGTIAWEVIAGGANVNLSATSGGSTTVTPNNPVQANTTVTVRAKAAAKPLAYYADHTFTLKPHTFNITFNKGDGTTAAQNGVTYGSTTPLIQTTWTRTGYTFNGWALQDGGDQAIAGNATAAAFTSNATAKMPGATVNLYTTWIPIAYKVKYRRNDGTNAFVEETGWVYDTPKQLKSASSLGWTRSGYILIGWGDDPNINNNGIAYSGGQSVVNLVADNNGVKDIYAAWESAASMPPMGVPDAAANYDPNDTNPLFMPAVAVAAAGNQSFILKVDGTLWAAGDNTYGQLGLGNESGSIATFTKIGANRSGFIDGKKVISVAAGPYHTLAITEDGKVWAAGANHSGQLGVSDTYSNVFIETPITSDAAAVVASGATTANIQATAPGTSYVLKKDGSLWAAGNNESGQLGTGSTSQAVYPFVQVIDSGVTAIAAGKDYALAIKNGKVFGAGKTDAMGLGTFYISWTAAFPPRTSWTDTGFGSEDTLTSGAIPTKIAASQNFCSYVIASDACLYGAGLNANKELGLQGIYLSQLDGGKWANILNAATYIGAGEGHAFIVHSGGGLYMAGKNNKGQLGREHNTTPGDTFESVTDFSSGASGFAAAAAGKEHSLALKDDGKVYAVGSNSAGQLGRNDNQTEWDSGWAEVQYAE